MSRKLSVALIQFTAARDPAPNIETVSALVREAVDGGAEFVLTPEVTDMLEPSGKAGLEKAQTMDGHQALAAFRELAAEVGRWLLVGSVVVRRGSGEQSQPLANRSVLIDARGALAATYDKIHMFDVDVDDGQRYRESERFRPGEQAVIAETPWAKVGMSVCYDVRFAALYRMLAHHGAEILTVPAAFTAVTGAAHWHTLLRARAIETGSFVLAPAQTGTHAEGRQTFGHSLVVDPWGEVLADGGTDPGIVRADIDLDAVSEARRRIPSLRHDRPFLAPEPSDRGIVLAGD